MNQPNPLSQYFRTEKFFITLPCTPNMYPEGVIEYSDSGEVGVMGMTAADELRTKNPDALLNGEAITGLLTSCIPAIKKPKELLANDIDACLLAIKHASYGDDIETNADCPECDAENSFSINITQSIANITPLKDEYFIETEDGMRIYGKPLTFRLLIKTLRQQFEQEKIMSDAQNPAISDEQKLKLFSRSFSAMADMTGELILGCIKQIVVPDTDEPITDEKHIEEFLNNVEKERIEQINTLLQEINSAGIKKTLTAKCKKCEHEWEVNIDFNPMTFFTES